MITIALLVSASIAQAGQPATPEEALAQHWTAMADNWLTLIEQARSLNEINQVGERIMPEVAQLNLEYQRFQMEATVSGNPMPYCLQVADKRVAAMLIYMAHVVDCWREYPRSGCHVEAPR